MAIQTDTLTSTNPITILKDAKAESVKVKHLCNHGFCGRCTVKVLTSDSISEPTKREVAKLGEAKLKEGYRLGCQTTFSGTITFEHGA